MKKHAVTLLIVGIACLFGAGTSDTSTSSSSQPLESTVRQASEAEKMDIRVTSLIVKRIEGKHRYFFDIRNHDTRPFKGSVKIQLLTQADGNRVGKDTFSTTKPITAGAGTVVHMTINTGPPTVHGSNGVNRFTYEVTMDNVIVAKGAGAISSKYEVL